MYQVWATAKDGEGMVQDLGLYEDVEGIQIHTGMFNDCLITIEYKHEKQDNER
jgi:hypothetical protein